MLPNNGGGQKLIHENVHEVSIMLTWSIISTLHSPVPTRTVSKLIIACDSCSNIETGGLGYQIVQTGS